jgi:hypothetical protein
LNKEIPVTLAYNPAFRSALALSVVFFSFPVAVALAAPAETAAPAQRDNAAPAVDHRAQLVQHLVDRGATPEQATTIVSALTEEDVRVLAENPGMLNMAEANSTWIAWGVLMAVIALAITLIAIANN